jgi:hypothetical protein
MSAALGDLLTIEDTEALAESRVVGHAAESDECQASDCAAASLRCDSAPTLLANRAPNDVTNLEECENTRCVLPPLQYVAMSAALHDLPENTRETSADELCPNRCDEADEQDSLKLTRPCNMQQENAEENLIPEFDTFSLPYPENNNPLARGEENIASQIIESHPASSIANSPLYLAAMTNPFQLQVRVTSDESLASNSSLAVRSIIDFSRDKRIWALNVEDICRTECSMMRKLWNLGVCPNVAFNIEASETLTEFIDFLGGRSTA